MCLVEWADLVMDLLPEDTIILRLDYGENEEERIIIKEAKVQYMYGK